MLPSLSTKLGSKIAGEGGFSTLLGSKASNRDRNILKNVALSFSFKGLSILLTLAIIPLSIDYIDSERYGVWITMSAMLNWINLMDVGLGNGLRNKLVEALATNNIAYGQKLISTTYALVISIVFAIMLIVGLILPWINLPSFFNIHTVGQSELLGSIIVSFVAFCLLFILKPLTAVIMANQQASLDNFIILIGNTLGIAGILLLKYTTANHGSLIQLVTVFSLAPPLAYLLGSLYIYRRFPLLTPSVQAIDLTEVKNLAGKSLQFFIIQIASAIVLTSNSVVISQLFGNETVTKYNVALRYFSVVMIVQTIVLTPIWSAVTEAYVKQDYNWIRSALKKLILNSLLLCLGLGLQVILAPIVFKYWLGSQVSIDSSLLLAVALATSLMVISSAFTYIINGVGTLRVQTMTAICTSLLSVPTALYLGHAFGPVGVVLANCMWIALFLPLRIVQCYKIVTNTSKNIWSK